MRVELVTIGTELMLGFTVDGNAAVAGRMLAEVGIRVARRTTVDDEGPSIRSAVLDALARTGIVITTGGLGPTRDDVTKTVLAELFDAPLEFQPAVWDAVVRRFASFGRTPSPANRSQAEVPRGAEVLPNRRGTAPGLWLEGPLGVVIMLPGVPPEMAGLLREEVLPRLVARTEGAQAIRSLVLRTFGIPESALADRLGPHEADLAPLTLAFLPGTDGVDLRLTAWGLEHDEGNRRFARAVETIREAVGDHLYATGETSLAEAVLTGLAHRGRSLVLAESCTGGLIGARLTRVPGSSAGFHGGVVCYANDVKRSLLGVPDDLLATHGAVSEAAARAMAEGALARLGGSIALAVTGIAGPDGGTAEKPVGLVYLAVADQDGVETHRVIFPGNREEIRERAAQAGLFFVLRRLGGPGPPALPW